MEQMHFDVAVVGAGMFGSAAAKYLSQSQAKVALIGPDEPMSCQAASTQQSFGAYYDQARITRRLGWDAVWAETDARSLNRFRTIEAESGISFFHEAGSLVLMARSIIRRTESILKQCQGAQIPVERLREDIIEQRWPYLKTPPILSGIEGLYEKHMAGYLNPRQLVKAQQKLFQRDGGSLIRGSVIKTEKDDVLNCWHLQIVIDQQLHHIYADKVLIAAGAFVNHHILPHGYKLDLHAFSEPNLLFEVDQSQVEEMRSMPTLITVDPEDTGNQNLSIYLLPPILYPDHKWYVRIGPGMQPIVEQINSLESMRQWYIQQKITQEQRTFLMSMQQQLLPDLKPKSIREACCIIEKTPSHYPYIGPIDEDSSLNIVVGGNGHGARGSDEIGRLAACLTLTNSWDSPLELDVFKPVLTADCLDNFALVCKPPFGLC